MSGRIPQSFIDEVLDRTDLVELIGQQVKLRKAGRSFVGLCPFHDEKSPSFNVNPDKQFYHCFGCGAGGNAVTFLLEQQHLEFIDAIEQLAGRLGLEVPREGPQQNQQNQNKPLYEVLNKSADYYTLQLQQHPQAQMAHAYLQQRGLSQTVVETYQLGFAPPGWDNLLQLHGREPETLQKLLDAGLIIDNTEKQRQYDRFRQRLMFPIRDVRGRVIGFGGRVFGDDKPKYLNSPETPVFHKSRELYGLYEAKRANKQLDQLIVVEGYMDVVALAQFGFLNAVATLGTACGEEHLIKLFRQVDRVTFCFDGDEAGQKAAERALLASLPQMEDGRQVQFLFLPNGEDPDSWLRQQGRDSFASELSEAQPLSDFFFHYASKGVDLSSMDGRAHLSKIATPLLHQLPDGAFRALMLAELANRTGLQQQTVDRLIEQQPAPFDEPPEAVFRAPPPLQQPTPPQASPAFISLPPSAKALTILLHQPQLALQVSERQQQTLAQLQGGDNELLQEILALLQNTPDASTGLLLGHWYGQPQGQRLTQLLGQEQLIPEQGFAAELMDAIEHLCKLPTQYALDSAISKVASTRFSLLTDAEKNELKQLLETKAKDGKDD